jgi:hypothetical protein
MTMDCSTEARSATTSISELRRCSGLEFTLQCTEDRLHAYRRSTCLVVRRQP